MADEGKPRDHVTIAIRLTRQQRGLLLDMPTLPADLVKALRIGRVEDGEVVCELTVDCLERLLDFVSDAAENATSDREGARLDEIYGRLIWVLDNVEVDLEESSFVLPGDLPDGLREFVLEILQDPSVQTPADVERRVTQWALEKGARPDPELEGLSPLQVINLIQENWSSHQPAVLLNELLTVDDVAEIPIFHNARYMLRALIEAGSVKATQKGAFPRKLVNEFLDNFKLQAKSREETRMICRTVNEKDVPAVATLHIVLRCARLVRLEKGVLKATKKASNLVKDANAGKLYALLFRTFFSEFNIAYQDRYVEAPEIQSSVPYSLYVLSQKADDWCDTNSIAHEILLPYVRQSLPRKEEYDYIAGISYARILFNLLEFGLLEGRGKPEGLFAFGRETHLRKSGLFDRFFTFNPNLDEA